MLDLAVENLERSMIKFLRVHNGPVMVDRFVPEMCNYLIIGVHDDSFGESTEGLRVHVWRASVERDELVRTIPHPLTADWFGK